MKVQGSIKVHFTILSSSRLPELIMSLGRWILLVHSLLNVGKSLLGQAKVRCSMCFAESWCLCLDPVVKLLARWDPGLSRRNDRWIRARMSWPCLALLCFVPFFSK